MADANSIWRQIMKMKLNVAVALFSSVLLLGIALQPYPAQGAEEKATKTGEAQKEKPVSLTELVPGLTPVSETVRGKTVTSNR